MATSEGTPTAPANKGQHTSVVNVEPVAKSQREWEGQGDTQAGGMSSSMPAVEDGLGRELLPPLGHCSAKARSPEKSHPLLEDTSPIRASSRPRRAYYCSTCGARCRCARARRTPRKARKPCEAVAKAPARQQHGTRIRQQTDVEWHIWIGRAEAGLWVQRMAHAAQAGSQQRACR